MIVSWSLLAVLLMAMNAERDNKIAPFSREDTLRLSEIAYNGTYLSEYKYRYCEIPPGHAYGSTVIYLSNGELLKENVRCWKQAPGKKYIP